MPKITDARREARRAQILDAALRCFVRNGYQQTSMADIIAEADLSVGAIYSYFPSKRHLVIGVASRVIEGRRSDLRAAGADHVLSPSEIVEIVLSGVGKDAPVVALIQVWAEAVVDDEIRSLLQEALRSMQAFLVESLTRWAEAHPDASRGEDADAWARASVPVLMGLIPGFALQSAIFDDFDPEGFVKDFPIAVTGETAQVEAFTTALDENADGRFAVAEVADRDEAVRLIEEREIYGAVIVGASPEVLTASAGGAVQAQVMSQLAGQLQAQVSSAASAGIKAAVEQTTAAVQAGQMPPEQGQQVIQQALATEIPTVATTDVVPLADTDPRGVGLTAAAFPMVLGGMIGGILISLVVTGVWRRFASITAYALIAGVSLTAVLQPWFGILQGSFLVNWMAMSLSLLATGAFIVGANAVFGRIGIAIGAVATMFIGNPISSVAQPVQFLPGAWGAIGQFFVPGASMTLLRELSYFPDAPQLQSWLVLGGWAVAGIVMMFLGHFRNEEVVHIEGSLEKVPDAGGQQEPVAPVAAVA